MSTPASNENESSKMKKLTSGAVDESIRSRLPRGNESVIQSQPVVRQQIPASPSSDPDPEPKRSRFKFLPAFWTIASVMSITVNIVLQVALLIMLQMFGAI